LLDPTIEDKYQKTIEYGGKEILLDILDTNGHEEYVALMDGWIRSCQGFFLMYDIGRRGSFDHMERFYQQILTNKNSSVEPAVLVGNCCDREYTRVVSKEEGLRLAERLRIPFFETSALSGENVTEVFLELIEAIATSTGPAIRRHRHELKHLSTWNIKRRRELAKQIRRLEHIQAGVEKEILQTRRRTAVTGPLIQVRPSTLVADIGRLFNSEEVQPFDLAFTTVKAQPTTVALSGTKRRSSGPPRSRNSFTNTPPVTATPPPLEQNDIDTVLSHSTSSLTQNGREDELNVFCHKTIVMVRCPGLLKKHRKDTRWNEDMHLEQVYLPDWIDAATLRNLLQFAYTGSAGVTSSQEALLLRLLGSYVKFTEVVNSCDRLLDSTVFGRAHAAQSPSPSLPSSPLTPQPAGLLPFPELPTPVRKEERKRKSWKGTFSLKGKAKAEGAPDFLDGSDLGRAPPRMQIQAGLKSYFDDFRQLLGPAFASLCDVCFVVEGKPFPLHRLILVSRSSYFRSYFKYEAGTGPFDLPDMSTDTFGLVIEFLYTGAVQNLNIEDAGPLLVAADMLNLEGLIDICELMMGRWVSGVEDPLEVLELLQDSGDFGARQLRSACVDKLAACYPQIADSPEYATLDFSLKTQILAARKAACALSPSSTSSSYASATSASSSSFSAAFFRSTSPSFATSDAANSPFGRRRSTF